MFLTGKALADLLQYRKSAISNAKTRGLVRPTEGELYDTNDPDTRMYILRRFHREYIRKMEDMAV